MATYHHKRWMAAAAKAVIKPANYSGVIKTLTQCSAPLDFLSRYVRNRGEYPADFRIRTPIGPVSLTAFTPDDLLTINEIFFRGDYGDDRNARVVVDFGSNIGISAAYFLSRNPDAFVYCHEPLPQNVERLRANLKAFEGRYALNEFAVAMEDGDGRVRLGAHRALRRHRCSKDCRRSRCRRAIQTRCLARSSSGTAASTF